MTIISPANKSFLFKLLGGSLATIVIISLFSAIIIIAPANNFQKVKINPQDQLTGNINNLKIYIVSGKIVDIQDKTFFLEAPVFDIKNKRWATDKKEIRKLTVGDKTKLLKQAYEWDEKEKEMELETDEIKFADLKIGDRLNANYSGNILGAKDFTPTLITILPN